MANWKLLGLAGLAGVAAAGVVVARRDRTWEEPTADELRARLHQRLAEAHDTGGGTVDADPAPSPDPG